MASHKTKTGDENVKMQKQRIKLAAKPWTKILLVVNVGSLEKRSNQPKYKEQKHKKSKDYCKADLKQRILFFITIFQLAIPAFFRFTDVTLF